MKHVIIVGAGEVANEYLGVIENNKSFGYDYSGYVANTSDFQGIKLGNYADLYEVLNKYKPDEVVCALDIPDSKYLENIVSDCEKSGTKISIIPFCYKYIPSQPYIDQIGSIPLINVRRIPLDNLGNAFMKRTLDIIGSLILIICTSPIMLFTSIIIKLTSKGPVIFRQKRVGLNKSSFTMYKFRSMKVNSEEQTAWSTNIDPRKTKFGSFIRKFSIDELPQFFNVLKGDMSLVGPRPELPHFVENFKDEIPLYMVKHQVKPGITGLAQINGFRGDTSIKKRIEFDIHYIENWSILMDIGILFKTVFKGMKNNEQLVKGNSNSIGVNNNRIEL
ncbi:UDP-glucose:undecaprenyl-phosphate glucose-1-phosphate transferase [Clostridium sp. BL-8]|nr:UDP-glucose:undecaprenyl-phosphate glucose-1-phosphate transferase [Clostridium sp. BL-8]